LLPRSAEIQPLFLRFVTLSWRGTAPGWAGWLAGAKGTCPACTQVQVGAGIEGLGPITALLRSMQPTVPTHRLGGLATRGHTCSRPWTAREGRQQEPQGSAVDGRGPQTVQGGLTAPGTCLLGAGLPAHPPWTLLTPSDFSGRWAVPGGSGRWPAFPPTEACRPAFPPTEACRPASSDRPTHVPDRLICSKTIQCGQHWTAWPS